MPDALRPLPRKFFNRDPREVSRELLGKLLVRRRAPQPEAHLSRRTRLLALGREPSDDLVAGRIVEAEAYLGLIDPGSHAFNGLTKRNAVLFGPPGHAYVYFIYGNHYCMNISCQPEGEAGGILLRALEPVFGVELMAARRDIELSSPPHARELRQLSSGPGKLAQALGITIPRDNGKDLCRAASDLFVASDGWESEEILATPRINVTRAPHDLWRFIVGGNRFVSGTAALNGHRLGKTLSR